MDATGFQFNEPRLEEEIRLRFEEAARGGRAFETRRVRAGVFRTQPLRIHARRRLERALIGYYTADQAAHLISLALPHLPDDFADNLRDVLLLPSLVQSDTRLLTHIYWPSARLLAFYLYPHRFDEAAPQASARLGETAPLGRLGLTGRVLEAALLARDETGLKRPRAGELHKFIAPAAAASPAELERLQAEHELFSDAYPR